MVYGGQSPFCLVLHNLSSTCFCWWYIMWNQILKVIKKDVSTEKNAHHERCELSFTGAKIRTIAQETAFQTVLRNCSKEVRQEVSEGGVCAIKPMFFGRRLTEASLFISYWTPTIYQAHGLLSKYIFSISMKNKLGRHLWFVVTPRVTFSLPPQFTNFVDQQNVGWEEYELLFSYESLRSAASTFRCSF